MAITSEIYHKNLNLKQNLLILENLNPQNFLAIWYIIFMHAIIAKATKRLVRMIPKLYSYEILMNMTKALE